MSTEKSRKGIVQDYEGSSDESPHYLVRLSAQPGPTDTEIKDDRSKTRSPNRYTKWHSAR